MSAAVCARCGKPYRAPGNQRFCESCGAPAAQLSGGDADAADRSPPEREQPAQTKREVAAKAGGPFASLFQHGPREQAPDERESRLGAVARRGSRFVNLTIRRTVLPVRRIYMLLGEALVEQHRYEEAGEAYTAALREAAGDPSTEEDVYASLADVTVGMAVARETGRPAATRAALEAVLRAPNMALRTAGRLLHVIDGRTLDQHAGWIARDWLPELRRVAPSAANGINCELLAGRAALYAGETPLALDLFASVAKQAPSVGKEAAARLDEAALPPALPQATLPAWWLLAQAAEALGAPEVALARVDGGLEADDESAITALTARGRLLESLQRDEEAYGALMQLGRELGDRERFAEAVQAFDRAAVLDPLDPAPLWLGAAYRRLGALLDTHPWVDAGGLHKARDDIERGVALRQPAAGEAWVYTVMAVVEDALSDVDDEPASRSWKGVLAAELAVAIDPTEGDSLAVLARCLRKLRMYSAARHAFERGLASDPENALAAQEEVVWHAVTGSTVALEKIERNRDRVGAIVDVAAAHVHQHDGRPNDAIELLDQIIETQPDTPFVRLQRWETRILLGRDATDVDLDWIWKATGGEDDGGASPASRDRAWAAWGLGELEVARGIFETYAPPAGRDPFEAALGLAMCALSAAQPDEAQRRLEEALTEARCRGEILQVACMLRVAHARGVSSADDQLVGLAEGRIAELLEAMPTVISGDTGAAREELRKVADSGATPEVGMPAARVALARLAFDARDFREAADLYARLGSDGDFPQSGELEVRALREWSTAAQNAGDLDTTGEAQARLGALKASSDADTELALARAEHHAGKRDPARLRLHALQRRDPGAEALLRVGDQLLALDHAEGAASAYAAAERDAKRGPPELRSATAVRMGVLRALSDDVESACALITRGIDLASGASEDTASTVIADCERLAQAAGRRGSLDAVERTLAEDERLGEHVRLSISASRLAQVRVRTQATPRIAPVLPIVLSVHGSHFPDGKQSALADELLYGQLPALRTRMSERTGVQLPGVKLEAHAEPLPDGMDYAILVREVVFASGLLPREHRLCTDASGCAELGLSGRMIGSAALGGTACWLPENEAAKAAAEGLPVIDHADALTWHLDLVLRPVLARFVGVSEIEYELRQWALSGEEGWEMVLEQATGDLESQVGLVRLIRRLVREQMPVDTLGAVLATYADARGEGVDTLVLVERVRRAVARSLDQDRLDRRLEPIDAELQQRVAGWVRVSDGTRILAAPAEAASAVLDELGEVMQTAPFGITVTDADLRPFMQRLVESRWPHVVVVSEPELEILRRAPEAVESNALGIR